MLDTIKNAISGLWSDSGFHSIFVNGDWKSAVMILISLIFLYLAIAK